MKVQVSLSVIIIFLMGINIIPAWQVYESRLSITTDSPTGSSFAERYLILGDWPASDVYSALEDNNKYLLIKDKKSAKNNN
ncbi:hypothetical protein Ssed_2378 [Shewanella sediminis HAW-EB3]|uniref:Uncharacterized protein n=1 Tax=Shewanella sediminis (strain HAW-EB3) TaxID=425104 RepID=A8FVW4_SHESH|nr:hypothetical protein Ssed_2378 [Shewanella sediminis HAW-EB3]